MKSEGELRWTARRMEQNVNRIHSWLLRNVWVRNGLREQKIWWRKYRIKGFGLLNNDHFINFLLDSNIWNNSKKPLNKMITWSSLQMLWMKENWPSSYEQEIGKFKQPWNFWGHFGRLEKIFLNAWKLVFLQSKFQDILLSRSSICCFSDKEMSGRRNWFLAILCGTTWEGGL